MLYPLSYEGASAQLTCQRVPTADRACQAVPTGLTCGGTDRVSTHRAHHAAVDRRRANECQRVPRVPISANDSPSNHRAQGTINKQPRGHAFLPEADAPRRNRRGAGSRRLILGFARDGGPNGTSCAARVNGGAIT